MARKTHDLAVVVGTYIKDGSEKNRYQNIGVVMEDDKGGTFLLIEPWFNPAGVPHQPGRSIMVSMFTEKPRETPERGARPETPEKGRDIGYGRKPPASRPYTQEPALDGFSDDVPF
jgi:hypothetical protein